MAATSLREGSVMRTVVVSLCLLMFLIVSRFPCVGAEASELYIPIGRSPGVSGVLTITGTVDSADYRSGTIVIATRSGTHTVRLVDSTAVYLDFSQRRQPNKYGSLRDCHAGDYVEVKLHEGAGAVKTARWVKIRR
jgi:hypothetical protein